MNLSQLTIENFFQWKLIEALMTVDILIWMHIFSIQQNSSSFLVIFKSSFCRLASACPLKSSEISNDANAFYVFVTKFYMPEESFTVEESCYESYYVTFLTSEYLFEKLNLNYASSYKTFIAKFTPKLSPIRFLHSRPQKTKDYVTFRTNIVKIHLQRFNNRKNKIETFDEKVQ